MSVSLPPHLYLSVYICVFCRSVYITDHPWISGLRTAVLKLPVWMRVWVCQTARACACFPSSYNWRHRSQPTPSFGVSSNFRRRKNDHRRYRAGERLLTESLSQAEPDDRKGVIYTPIWPQQSARLDSCGCPIHHPAHPPDCPCPIPHTRPKTLLPLQTSPCRQLECPAKSEFSVGEYPASSNFPMTSITPTFSTTGAHEDEQLTSSFTTFRPTMTSQAESTMTSAASMLTSDESTASSWDGQARMDATTSVLDLIRNHSLSIDHMTPCPVVEATADWINTNARQDHCVGLQRFRKNGLVALLHREPKLWTYILIEKSVLMTRPIQCSMVLSDVLFFT